MRRIALVVISAVITVVMGATGPARLDGPRHSVERGHGSR
jgi:hypothetical protein